MTRRSKKSKKPCLSDNRLKFRILFRDLEDRRLLPFDRVLHALGPICIRPGWKLWALHTPEQRREDIDHRVGFDAGGLPATG